jgi:hypothetical protein
MCEPTTTTFNDVVSFGRFEQTCCLCVVGGRSSSSKVLGIHNIGIHNMPNQAQRYLLYNVFWNPL